MLYGFKMRHTNAMMIRIPKDLRLKYDAMLLFVTGGELLELRLLDKK